MKAVRLVLMSGKVSGEIARDVGVSYESLRKYIKQHQVDGGIPELSPGASGAHCWHR